MTREGLVGGVLYPDTRRSGRECPSTLMGWGATIPVTKTRVGLAGVDGGRVPKAQRESGCPNVTQPLFDQISMKAKLLRQKSCPWLATGQPDRFY